MGVEIERKFLLASDGWRAGVTRVLRMSQGYLRADAACTTRVRVTAGDDGLARAWLTIKGGRAGLARDEFEYAIPPADALRMLATMCAGPLIEKARHLVPHGRHVWEIDVFEGDNAGLQVAELELADEAEDFARPAWLGAEVTGDARYYNSALAARPFKAWR